MIMKIYPDGRATFLLPASVAAPACLHVKMKRQQFLRIDEKAEVETPVLNLFLDQKCKLKKYAIEIQRISKIKHDKIFNDYKITSPSL